MLTAHAIKEIGALRQEAEARLLKLSLDEKFLIGRRSLKEGMGRVQRVKRRAEINEQVDKGRRALVAMEEWTIGAKPSGLYCYWKGHWLMDKRTDNYHVDAKAGYAKALSDKGYVRLFQKAGRYLIQRSTKGIIGSGADGRRA